MGGVGLRLSIVLMAVAVLASCATPRRVVTAPPRLPTPAMPAVIPNPVYKVGMPYEVGGVWYYPKEQPDYDETGIASWYGTKYHGRLTADGELFDRTAITAAHPTLPMPVNVRVTNLENGKSIVVRVNDRGPFVNGRIIDLSERAADLLGFRTNGTAKVRVRYLDRASLTGLGPATAAEQTPAEVASAVPAAPTKQIEAAPLPALPGVALAAAREVEMLPRPAAMTYAIPAAQIPDGSVTEDLVPPDSAIFVQAGAFSSLANAGAVATKLYSLGARVVPVISNGQSIYRVRIGPVDDVAHADALLAQVQALGHSDVQIVVDSTRS